jgi:hypothetical protein
MDAFVFRAEQFVARPLDEVFEFFSQAENLQQLTPEWLHFRILSVEPSPVRTGTMIRYSLRWRIFPIHWTSEIVSGIRRTGSSMSNGRDRTGCGIMNTVSRRKETERASRMRSGMLCRSAYWAKSRTS